VPYETHKLEIGIADRSYKDQIGIVDIAAGEDDWTPGLELRKINNRACASLINGASSFERIRSSPEFRRSAERGM
jgi:hypothetical protein